MQRPVAHLLPEGSWFKEWLNCFPLAEPPESYMLFSAMAMMGAALGRRVHFDQDIHQLFPMLNLLLIGPSGSGKSTSILTAKRFCLEMIPALEQPQFVGATTREKLHEDLVHDNRAVIFAPEFAAVINKQKYNEALVPYLTQLLDYEETIQLRTKSGDIQTVIEPSTTIIGGSTIEWLQEQLPDSATSGGFLARFLIVPEEHKARRVPNPKMALTGRQRIELETRRARMVDGFYRCLHVHKGEMEYEDYEAVDTYSTWYTSYIPATGHLAPFAARAGEFVTRLAILLAISRGSRAVGKCDIVSARDLYQYAHGKLQEVVVPTSQAGKIAKSILMALGDGAMGESEICRAMRNMCSAQDTRKFLESLLISKEIRVVEGKFVRVR